jgi:hypothetical protein
MADTVVPRYKVDAGGNLVPDLPGGGGDHLRSRYQRDPLGRELRDGTVDGEHH